MPSEAVDDYLKAIFELAGDQGRASTAALAKKLGVAPASVTGMLQKLAERNPAPVYYEKHRGARLSDEGRLRALEVIRHHRLIELYLHRFLGYRWDEVHEEADKLEHAISEKLEDRMAERLGDPEADPHGHPIPRKDGTIPERSERVLLDLSVGQEATVSRVSDGDPEILRYLFGLRIVPGTQLRLTEREPFDGPLMLEIDGLEKLGAIGPTVASLIHVVPAGEREHESEEGGPGETNRPGPEDNGR